LFLAAGPPQPRPNDIVVVGSVRIDERQEPGQEIVVRVADFLHRHDIEIANNARQHVGHVGLGELLLTEHLNVE
jgi:hypothetical protein